MTIHVETIMVRIEALLQQTITAGSTTKRVDGYDVVDTPSIRIFQSDDIPLGELGSANMKFLDSDLGVRMRLYIASTTAYQSDLNKLRGEVNVIMMETNSANLPNIGTPLDDAALGLSFIQLVISTGAAEILVNPGETPISIMDVNYRIRYRANEITLN